MIIFKTCGLFHSINLKHFGAKQEEHTAFRVSQILYVRATTHQCPLLVVHQTLHIIMACTVVSCAAIICYSNLIATQLEPRWRSVADCCHSNNIVCSEICLQFLLWDCFFSVSWVQTYCSTTFFSRTGNLISFHMKFIWIDENIAYEELQFKETPTLFIYNSNWAEKSTFADFCDSK